MPAKRKLLPQPCPICGLNYGTMQLVSFQHAYYSSREIVCRIGHYNKKVYKHGKRERRGRYWHQFKLPWTLLYKSGLSNFDVTAHALKDRKSYTFRMPNNLYEIIKKEGWHVKSEALLEIEFKSFSIAPFYKPSYNSLFYEWRKNLRSLDPPLKILDRKDAVVRAEIERNLIKKPISG